LSCSVFHMFASSANSAETSNTKIFPLHYPICIDIPLHYPHSPRYLHCTTLFRPNICIRHISWLFHSQVIYHRQIFLLGFFLKCEITCSCIGAAYDSAGLSGRRRRQGNVPPGGGDGTSRWRAQGYSQWSVSTLQQTDVNFFECFIPLASVLFEFWQCLKKCVRRFWWKCRAIAKHCNVQCFSIRNSERSVLEFSGLVFIFLPNDVSLLPAPYPRPHSLNTLWLFRADRIVRPSNTWGKRSMG